MSNLRIYLRSRWSPRAIALMLGVSVAIGLGLNLLASSPALAHHPFGGVAPKNMIEGFLSGLGHPVVGFDHLLFTVATGLLAVGVVRGLMIPIAFALMALAGTGIHLLGMDLPAPESIIAFSVVIFGLLLAVRQRPETFLIVALAAGAGLFHGYAYGESVVGAEATPLLSYLIGFTVVQMAIALSSYVAATLVMQKGVMGNGVMAKASRTIQPSSLALRFSGFAIFGAGSALLSSAILG